MASKFSVICIVLAGCVVCGKAYIQAIDFMETKTWTSLTWNSRVDHFPRHPFENMTGAGDFCSLNSPDVYLDEDQTTRHNRESSNVMMLKTCLRAASGNVTYEFELKIKLAGCYICRGTSAVGDAEFWLQIIVSEPVEAEPWYENMWSTTTMIAMTACNLTCVVGFTVAQLLKRIYIIKRLKVKRVYRNHLFQRSRTLDDPGLGQ